MKRNVVAMLLAGGQGSRLKSLTYDIAKPALPFGGKYRIIDFPLSNCTNSGIQTVGVLTQYQPHRLHHYIGLGTPWDLDQRNGGVTMLPPFAEVKGMRWYDGTANAIYQNAAFLNRYDPELVLVLSGDHIYKMNYQEMIDYHLEKGADVTISVIEVPWDEASRFGIMNTDSDLVVQEFVEKPEKPESNLASMGVYVFDWQKLKHYLEADNVNPESSHDFGKDVIPLMLGDGARMVAYPYKGYWKDVGTVESYWEANMDLLDGRQGLKLNDEGWRIYSSNPQLPPQAVTETGDIKESIANEGCVIEGSVLRSVLFQAVHVNEGAEIEECVIMSGVRIGKGAKLKRVIVPPNFTVPDHYQAADGSGEVMLLTEEHVQKWRGSETR